MKAKFVCYHLKNTGGICGNGCDKPEGCHLHCKAKLRRPCRACGKPTKIDKPPGIDNDLCSYCNKSLYQIRHVNILRDKALMFDQNSKVVSPFLVP
ncbi:hypothetical protein RclHR1_00300002 [Rhizophagus clarus]|uniref:Uncharacterized protein n=1 Tax=Rhizophagus clarus TaxID=94130 RepID=A0A2Z6R5N3_9GLOM|nr:hypothetical protein RclHR1_18580003 [Rhizophagus clarus]GBB97523.1 hypothetical protein RclHR1_00300002 [Rhizophagus clarus]GES74793.1 hypothetical protein GLOIN_2v1475818 [Rhizophagus clarus]GES92328.1 hypothetical protein GLOIN_2v1475818 [Rhizophagus clarus]GET00761.1 hypothetical protein GLOIN_2v1475818 [Rhizophagus clarus]